MRGLLLLLSALLLLESTDGNKEYNQLSQHDTEIIDKAIKLANKKYGPKHLDFASVLGAVSYLIPILSFYCKFVCFDFVFCAYASALKCLIKIVKHVWLSFLCFTCIFTLYNRILRRACFMCI